jgi:hypothetical protein
MLPFTDRSAQVQATLDQLPPTLQTVSNTLPPVRTLLTQADAFAAATRTTLANAPAALRDTVRLLSTSQTPLKNLSTTLALGQTAVPPTLALLKATTPALPTFNTALNDLMPTLVYGAPRACELSNGFSGWADDMKWGTASENYIEFRIVEQQTVVAGSSLPVIGENSKSLVNPYPGPCVNGIGEGGPARPIPTQQALGLTYTSGQTP